MDNGKKHEARILTTSEIRKEARNWTLAGDVGLLAHLEQFSENIINKTQETQKRFAELVDDYEELYTKVGNVTNKFLALQNCQFVENRVYDEETPTEEKAEVKVRNDVEQEKLLLMQYKEAVEVGIKLLDTHFQEVQLPPNSDSDDDDDDEVSNGNSVVWKAKNPYAEKKFPLLIGSAEWWADDHVGLGTEEEEEEEVVEEEEDILETEKIVSNSETDVESLKSVEKEITKSTSSSSMENVKSNRTKGELAEFSDSSSEDLFGLGKNENVKSSISDDLFFRRSESAVKQTDDFLPDFDAETEKNDFSTGNRPPEIVVRSEERIPEAIRPQKVDNAFTRELMAKLSSVTNKKESGAREEKENVKEKEKKQETEKEKEREMEKKNQEKMKPDDSLFDETDDSSDLFSSRVEEKGEGRKKMKNIFFESESEDDLFKRENGLFSNGKGLFESEEPKQPKSRSTVDEISEESEKSLKPKIESLLGNKNPVNDLFDDLDDDENLFASKPITKSMSSVEGNGTMKRTKSEITTGLGWNSDEALFDNGSSYGVAVDDDLFSSTSLFGPRTDSTVERLSRPESNLDLFPEEPREEEKNENFEDFKSKNSIFESKIEVKEHGSFPGDVFRESPGMKASILDSDDDDDLFSKEPRDKKSTLKATAFVDDDDAALFGEIPKLSDAVSMSSSRSSLFDDLGASKSRLASVFEKDKGGASGGGAKAEEDLFSVSEDSLFGGGGGGKGLGLGREKTKVEGERSSLFGGCDDDEDLFGGEKSRGVEVEEVKKGLGSVKDFVDELEDDLFKSTKLRETKSDIFRKSEGKLFVDDGDDSDLFSAAPTVKPKPPTSLRLKGSESEDKGKTVGKLNIPDNLKVRFESAAKRISPGGVKVSGEAEEEKKKEGEDVEEKKKDDPLDDPPPSSNLLKCPSKDRVKIPGRRRPQSRRARQEALRASGTWDLPSPSPAPAPAPAPLSNPLSPSTDEEDFFKVPELDTNFEKEDQSIFKNDLFESSKKSNVEDNLLFDGAPVLSPLGTESDKTKPLSIFDDNDDSLFKGSKLLPQKGEQKAKKSLFDESDEDEDDLFGEKSVAKTVATTSLKPLPAKKQDNKEKEKEEEKESSTFVDPLGLITND